MTAPQGEQPAAAAYRREIDGLRAIAVMAVIVAHSGLGWLPGGFAGVDVFFVISGYLITGILLRELASDSFSFRRFYARRARRILPALFVMLAVCWVAAAFLMTPSQFKDHALAQASALARRDHGPQFSLQMVPSKRSTVLLQVPVSWCSVLPLNTPGPLVTTVPASASTMLPSKKPLTSAVTLPPSCSSMSPLNDRPKPIAVKAASSSMSMAIARRSKRRRRMRRRSRG